MVGTVSRTVGAMPSIVADRRDEAMTGPDIGRPGGVSRAAPDDDDLAISGAASEMKTPLRLPCSQRGVGVDPAIACPKRAWRRASPLASQRAWPRAWPRALQQASRQALMRSWPGPPWRRRGAPLASRRASQLAWQQALSRSWPRSWPEPPSQQLVLPPSSPELILREPPSPRLLSQAPPWRVPPWQARPSPRASLLAFSRRPRSVLLRHRPGGPDPLDAATVPRWGSTFPTCDRAVNDVLCQGAGQC